MDIKELLALVEKLKPIVYEDLAARSFLQEQGITVTRSDFYSEIPTVQEIKYAKQGPRLDRIFPPNIELLQFLKVLQEFSSEFCPPNATTDEMEFAWENSQFSYSDAMAYYCMIRFVKPKQILEIGGGFSTLIAKFAIEKNGFGKLKVIEPYPREFLRNFSDIELIETAFQDLDTDILAESIVENDIVFIDSTHSTKFGSEVLNIYLDFLHLISSKCFIHVHDVYLPDPLPVTYMLEQQIYWGEQYLLYAYMLNNNRTKILYGSRFHSKNNPVELNDFMAGKFEPGGASIWFIQNPSLPHKS